MEKQKGKISGFHPGLTSPYETVPSDLSCRTKRSGLSNAFQIFSSQPLENLPRNGKVLVAKFF